MQGPSKTMTLDEIKMDSDKLATGMKQLDDSARMSTGAVGDGFKKISAEADNLYYDSTASNRG